MEKELSETFSEEVEKYRIQLLTCAKKSQWDTFKMNAGRLFDYVESIEMSVIEKKFFRISRIIIIVLCLMVAFICKTHFDIHCGLERIREVMILLAIAGCSFQLYFYVNFRTYMDYKLTSYKRRRDSFIRNIEQDFKEF